MQETTFITPNFWNLSGDGKNVRYWTFTLGPIGAGADPPHLVYQDSQRTLILMVKRSAGWTYRISARSSA
jgi:hypothetical protein